MSALDLLNKAQHLGVRLSADGDRLHVDAPKGVLTPDLIESLRAHKPELLRLLGAPAGGSPGQPAPIPVDQETMARARAKLARGESLSTEEKLAIDRQTFNDAAAGGKPSTTSATSERLGPAEVADIIKEAANRAGIRIPAALDWLTDTDLEDIATGKLSTKALATYFCQCAATYCLLWELAPPRQGLSEAWRERLKGYLPAGTAVEVKPELQPFIGQTAELGRTTAGVRVIESGTDYRAMQSGVIDHEKT